ncbi:MAG: TonB-dependent receptor [Paludibacter sp.]|nr:TonB-dependent receptor [Paludibacter sp.]
MRKLTFLFACLFIAGVSMVLAQTSISGKVISAEDGEAIVGATVMVKGTTTGTITNVNGNFTISLPGTNRTLVVSYVGMETAEVQASPNMVVRLNSDAAELEEVLVVAYGNAKKYSFTGSAATVKSENIEKRKVSNVTKALEGVATGVQVTSGSGQPGSGANVYIRGLGSINASNLPLYVVDGIPYDGNISAINSNDIESVTVLKDASAGALYGARGANGVIMITTKKGKSGKAELNFKANFGLASRAIPRYETMKSQDFIEAAFSAFYNEQIDNGVAPDMAGAGALVEMVSGGQRIFGANQMYNPYNYDVANLIDPATGKIRSDATLLWEDDWLDEVTRGNALRQEYTFDMRGGNDVTNYFVSFGYLDHNGLLETTNFKRYSGRTNVDSKPLDWIALGLNSNFSRTESNYLGATGSYTSNVWSSAQMMGPIFPIYLRDRNNNGAFKLDEFGEKQFDYGASRPAGQQGDFNSIATLYDDLYNQKINNVSSRGHVILGDTQSGWAKGLKLSFTLGADYYGLDQLEYYNPFFGNAKDSKGRVTKTSTTMFSYTANQMLSYNTEIGGLHHIDAMVAHEYYDLSIDRVEAEKTGFPFGGLYQPDGASTVFNASGSTDSYRIESYLGRINYDYADKYYLSASLRRDASSRFHKDYRWGNFWSVGGNYRVSNESFMEDYSSWLDNMSIRASYGVQGNDKILNSDATSNYYAWQALYDLAWSNASEAGALVTSIQNEKVSWEKNANFNVGLDISVLDKKVEGSIEYYQRRTSDLLLNYPMPLSTGFSGYSRNSGSMLNTGLELTLTGQLIKTKDLQWNATLMASTIKNEVLKLTDEGKDITSGTRIIREGEAFQSYYLPKSAGVDPLTGVPLYWATVNNAGDDVDPYVTSSSVLANASRYIAGDMFPDLFGSISTDLKYKSFDFSATATYSIGGEMIDGVYQQMRSFYYPAQAKHVDLLRAWRKPGDITDIPKYVLGGSITYTDDMLFDASYFSIKNVTLGYTLPSAIAKKAGLHALRVYATVDNLYMFTSLKGMNPQYSITGGTDYAYAPERLVSFGVDVKF